MKGNTRNEENAKSRGRRLSRLFRRASVRQRGGFEVADLPWLGVSLLAGCLVVAMYFATNKFPAYGAGLYMVIAERIVASGLGNLTVIPHYTARGVPFAYPPLVFYMLALIRSSFDIGPFSLTKILPAIFTVGYLIPTYLIARDELRSRSRAALVCVLIASNDEILRWHLSAGGVVRTVAFFFALCTIYAGIHTFESGDRRWLITASVGFSLTVLTHPTYALFVVITYLTLWVTRDRSPCGLMRGAIVGVAGIVFSAPWWLPVLLIHGSGVFLAASGTHGGIGGGLELAINSLTVWNILPLIGVVVLFLDGSPFLPIWYLALLVGIADPRFTNFIGILALVTAVGRVVDGRTPIGEWHGFQGSDVQRRRQLYVIVFALCLISSNAYLYQEMTNDQDTLTPNFVNEGKLTAMQWAQTNTPSDASFVVLGDVAEWFPMVTHRTILIGAWGVEWRSSEAYNRQYNDFSNVTRCKSTHCVEYYTQKVDVRPDYVFIPKGNYTVNGVQYSRTGSLERSFDHSKEYESEYENSQVVIYRAVVDESNRDADTVERGREPPHPTARRLTRARG